MRRPSPLYSAAALGAALACAGAPALASAEFTLVPLWTAGGTGSSPGEFGIPESVAIDSLGQVVVTDKGRMMLHVYDAATGRALFDVGSQGSTLGKFDRPNGIAVDRQGRILVVEQVNRRVQILDRDYQPIGSFRNGFQKPMGIGIHADGSIYVTDEARADVQVFDAEGQHLWTFGDDPRLARVESIELDGGRQRIFVCDESKSRVNVYDALGTFTGSFGSQGSGPGLFGNDPNAVRLDGRGRIYINDQGNSRINVYDTETRFVASFRNTGRSMESADGMALSEKHNLILVADQGNDRVIAFDLGEVQCRLAVVEAGKSHVTLAGLQVGMQGEIVDPGAGPVWADVPLEFTATIAQGGLQPGGFGILHVKSQRDPRGVCVRMPESAIGSGVYAASLELAGASDELSGRLATFADDVLTVHFAGATEVLSIPVARWGPPRATSVQGGLGADGRLLTDTPTFAWTFEEDSGRRSQSAFEMRIEETDGSLLWQSGIVASSTHDFEYDGPPFPTGVALRLRLRVAAGRAWSDWATVPLRRNVPPSGAVAVSPGDGTRVGHWPLDLRAAVPADPDGDPVRARLEILIPQGPDTWTHTLPLLDDMLEFRPRAIGLEENAELRWRVVVSDGFEAVPSPWWKAYRNDVEEPPGPPGPIAPRTPMVFERSPIFRWEAAQDPDPGTVLEYAVEWSPDSTFENAREMRAGSQCHVAWEGEPPPAPFWWRVRATDPTGHVARSATIAVGASGRDRQPPDEVANAVEPARDEPTAILERLPSPIRRGLRLRLATAGVPASIEVFDVRGRRLVYEPLGNDGTWAWEGADRHGRRIAPGIYWMRVRGATGIRHHKIVWGGD